MSDRSDLTRRVVFAIPLGVVAILLVAAGGWVFAVGAAGLGCVCLHELYELLDPRRPLRLAGFAAVVAAAVAARAGGVPALLFALWVALPLIFVLVAARPNLDGATESILSTGLGVWWVALAIGHAVLLRDLPHGGGIVIDSLVANFAGDTGAYFGGKSLGTRPLAPRISPRKTVEGLVAGSVATIAAALVASLYQDWLDPGAALLLGLAVAILAPLGDLFESLIKRDAGAKDTGATLGPHGGLLDRLDGVLFSIVGVYWVWQLFG